jgi:peroxiredoxin
MKRFFWAYSILALVLLSFTNDKLRESPSYIQDFSLKGIDNKIFNTKSNKAIGYIVVFTCNHCPFAKLYTKRLNELNHIYSKQGVPLLAINSMDSILYEEETFAFMQDRAKKEGYQFLYLQDASQSVVKLFGANHTPQAFIIWRENNKWLIKYNGAIDDNGQHPENAIPYVAQALRQLLAGKPVLQSKTESFGCRIMLRKL